VKASFSAAVLELVLRYRTLNSACMTPQTIPEKGWPEPCINTVYDRIFGDSPAKYTVYMYIWFWPTLYLRVPYAFHPKCNRKAHLLYTLLQDGGVASVQLSLCTASSEFRRLHRYLLKFLGNKTHKIGGEPDLENLMMRINFNFYYDNSFL